VEEKKFAVFEQIREHITQEDEEDLDEAIDKAVREVRLEKNKKSSIFRKEDYDW
jgi:hypothetical protein